MIVETCPDSKHIRIVIKRLNCRINIHCPLIILFLFKRITYTYIDLKTVNNKNTELRSNTEACNTRGLYCSCSLCLYSISC